jgi:hypothetical protein
MSTDYDPRWVRDYAARIDTDAEMQVIGRYLDAAMRLDFGGTRYVLRFERGRVAQVVDEPKLDDRYDWGFRAPLEVWRKFTSANPPACFHDFFAMLMRVPEFQLDGDSLKLMQNARAVQRVMGLMRGEAK